MSVSVRIPTILRTYTGGESEVSAEGGTLGEVLDDLDGSYSGIKGRILDETGQLRRFVNVYVGNDDVRFLDNLDTADARRCPDLGHPGRRRRLSRPPERTRPRPMAASHGDQPGDEIGDAGLPPRSRRAARCSRSSSSACCASSQPSVCQCTSSPVIQSSDVVR